MKPTSRVVTNCQRAFTWGVIDEVVRFCKKYNCGTVVFREPTLGSRDHLWLGRREVPYDWTGLETNLRHKCRQLGIDISVERIGMKELCERFGDESGPAEKNVPKSSSGKAVGAEVGAEGSREPQSDEAQGQPAGSAERSRFAGARKRGALASGGGNGDGKGVSGGKRRRG